MKKHVALLAIIFCVAGIPSVVSGAFKSKKVIVNTESFASIFVDGKLAGATSVTIRVAALSTVHVRVEKPGFITQERNYVNDDNHELPAKDYIQLEKDDALENSVLAEVANHDVDIRAGKPEEESWKLVNRIVTSYFDVLSITDKATGYLCTAWVVKSFKSATVRTRLIIKTSSSDPLSYKAKIVSEIAKPGTAASADEAFSAWGRLLRNFENTVPELQSRIAR